MLLTAGMPSCGAGAGDPTDDDTPATVNALRTGFDTEGIRTVLVGLRPLYAAVNTILFLCPLI